MRPLRTGTRSAGGSRSTNRLVAQKRWPRFFGHQMELQDQGAVGCARLNREAESSLRRRPILCNRFLATRPTAVAREHEAQRIDVDHLALKAVGRAFPSGLRRPGYLPTGGSTTCPGRCSRTGRGWKPRPTWSAPRTAGRCRRRSSVERQTAGLEKRHHQRATPHTPVMPTTAATPTAATDITMLPIRHCRVQSFDMPKLIV